MNEKLKFCKLLGTNINVITMNETVDYMDQHQMCIRDRSDCDGWSVFFNHAVWMHRTAFSDLSYVYTACHFIRGIADIFLSKRIGKRRKFLHARAFGKLF